METCAHKHPLTYCEKYGHTWVASLSAGFDVCAYVGGKGRACKAARRTPEARLCTSGQLPATAAPATKENVVRGGVDGTRHT
jgi:hypothetical protein